MLAFGTTAQIIIHSESSESFVIYGLLGNREFSGKTQPGKISIPMQPGIYIFSMSGYNTKVLVK
jgi:hypothetical protein